MSYSPVVKSTVPSPQRPFTSVFGMGTGVTSSLYSPGKTVSDRSPFLTTRSPRKRHHIEKEQAPCFEFDQGNKGQASRLISTGQLNTLLRLHIRPIKVVVFDQPSVVPKNQGKSNLGGGLALRCFQRLSVPYIATQRCRWHDNWNTRGTSFPVLSY